MTNVKRRHSGRSFKKFLSNSACALLIGGASQSLSSVPAFAQDNPDQYEDVIVVTGSLIRSRQKDFKTPSPVQTLDSSTCE